MDRRTFLIGLGISSMAAVGGVWLLVPGRESFCNTLKLLYDPAFEKISAGKKAETLLAELRRKKVITENGLFDQTMVKRLAETDPIESFDGYFYTQTELEVYSLAFLLQENCDIGG